ncbi:MAG: hypothetical protein ACPIOQ_59205 [Promethearchaeia archaeon]
MTTRKSANSLPSLDSSRQAVSPAGKAVDFEFDEVSFLPNLVGLLRHAGGIDMNTDRFASFSNTTPTRRLIALAARANQRVSQDGPHSASSPHAS